MGGHLHCLAPGRQKNAAVATVSDLTGTRIRPPAPIAMSLTTRPTGLHYTIRNTALDAHSVVDLQLDISYAQPYYVSCP